MIADLNSSHSFSMSMDNIRKLSEVRWYTGCKLFPYFFVLQSLPIDSVSHRWPVGFPVWPKLWKSQGTLYQMMISWQFSTLLHWTSSTSENKSDETMQKSIKDFWSILGWYHVYLWTSLCWKKVFMMQSPLLQQSCYKYLSLSFGPVTRCFPITPFHVIVSVATCSLKSLISTVNSVGDSCRKALFTSSTETYYSFVALGYISCNRHSNRSNTLSFNMQNRDPKGVQWNSQSDKRGSVRIPTPAWADIWASAPE